MRRARPPSVPSADAPEPTAQPLAEPIDIPLAQNRDFKVLLSSQGISSLGDAVSFTALPLLVLALTGSGLAMGIVAALQTLPGPRCSGWSPGRSPTGATASG